MRMAKDMTGLVFGRLTVLSRAANKGKQPAWLCQCSCGNTKVIAGEALRQKRTSSCGCKRRENFVARYLKRSDKSRSQNGARASHRRVTLEEALSEVGLTWPQRLQAYARGEA